MSRETDLRSIDYSALTAAVDPAEVRAFEAETVTAAPGWRPRAGAVRAAPALVALTVVFIALPALLILTLALVGFGGAGWAPLIVLGPVGVMTVSVATFLLLPSLRTPRRAFGWQEHYRLSRFAWDNGLHYSTEAAAPRYKGVLFANLPSIVYNSLAAESGRFEIGNIRYGQRGAADSTMTDVGHRGFLAVRIGGNLPHIVLDARANDGLMGGIGLNFSDHPTVLLEGDFNEHFTLYCPAGYERDALYILTPDLMAELLDESNAFDVELVGEWLFVYSMKPFDSTDAAVYQRLFRIVETVGARAARRSTNYRDDQYSSAAAYASKPTGPRMRTRIPRRFVALLIALMASISWIPFGLSIGVLPLLP